MKRPMVYVFIYFAVGIILGYFSDNVSNIGLGVFVCISIALLWMWRTKAPILFFLFLLLGIILTHNSIGERDKNLFDAVKVGKNMHVRGIVTEVSERDNNQILTVKCSKIAYPGGKSDKNIKLSVSIENGNVKLWDEVTFSGVLKTLRKSTVPGGFNNKLYMKTRGFDYRIYLEDIQIIGNKPVFFISSLRKLKANLNTVYDNVFPEREAGIIKALITGDKKHLDLYTKDLYQRAGITHVLAISGLHVSSLAAMLYFILKKLNFLSQRKQAFLVIAFLIVFAMFTGFAASTVRAVIMVSVGMVAIIVRRVGESINNIAIAAMIILLIEPLYLFDVGFQLSFITVTGIILALKILNKSPNMPKWLQGICMSFVATITSYPITAYYFQWISLVAVLANIVVVPLMAFLLGMAFITGVVGLLSMPVAVFFGGTAYYILKFYEAFCNALINIPNSFVCIGSPHIITMFLWYMASLVIYMCNPKKIIPVISLSVITATLVFSITCNRYIFKCNKLAFLDVGQGDSAVLTTYDKRAFVIDTGGFFNPDKGKNTGESIIMPYLHRLGITEIDGLFLSHMDNDHVGGAIELMKLMKVKALYISDYDFPPSLLYAQILSTAKNNNVPVYKLHSGDTANIENITISCLYPLAEGGIPFGDGNNGSTVLKLKFGDTTMLFTGDASIEDEDLMIRLGGDLNSDILKLGHHGSKYSSSTEFLKAVSPHTAIISSGENNTYGHPDAEALKRLSDENINILRTDTDGTVTVVDYNSGYSIQTMTSPQIIYDFEIFKNIIANIKI